MTRFTAAEVQSALGLVTRPSAGSVASVSTDTRTITPGSLFASLGWLLLTLIQRG